MSIAVILTDRDRTYTQAKRYFSEAESWARENCESFYNHEVLWVGDVSREHDVMAEYEFEDEKDVFMFKLRWL